MSRDKRVHSFGEGGLLALQVGSVGPRVWLGAAWAVLCGAAASGGLEASWPVLVVVLLTLVLADPVLGSVWALVSEAGHWRFPRPRKSNPGGEGAMPALPYTLPGSVGHRFSSFAGHALIRWRSTVWPRVGTSILGLGLLCLVALLVAASLGSVVFLVTAIALGVAGVALIDARSGGRLRGLLGSAFLGGLPWLLGYAALWDHGPVEGGLVSLAKLLVWPALYAATWCAYQWLDEGESDKGILLLSVAQVLAVAVLILVKQPIAAGVVALLLLPQLLLQPALRQGADGPWYLRSVQVFTMAAMMAMSVAVAL
jgi:hypothetical protein